MAARSMLLTSNIAFVYGALAHVNVNESPNYNKRSGGR